MTDKKQTEQKEKAPHSPIATEQAKEKAEREQDKSEKREAIQGKGVIDRTSKKLEVLEEINLYTPDTVTAERIRNINVEKVQEDAEVKEALQLIGTITVPILAKLAEGGIDLEAFDTPAEFQGILAKLDSEERFKKVREKLSNSTEQATIAKLQEMLSKPQSRLYKNFEAHWGKFIKKSREVIKEANDGIKGLATKPLKWLKENPGKAVLIAAGAYALYKIFTMEDNEKEKGRKKDWTDKIFNKKNGLALGVITIGALLGSGKVSEWIKKQLFGNTKEIALHAAEKAKEAAINAFNKQVDFDATKNRLLKLLPQKPEWLKTAKLQNILEDMGIDPEKTAHLEKYSGPSGAALLLKDWMTRKHKVDAATQKILEKFIQKEKTAPTPAEKKEELKEYGEFVPLKDAWSNYGPHLEKALSEMKKWANENKEFIAVAAIFLASFESIRDALKSGVNTGFDGFVSLAKLPWKAVKGFPMSSFFVVSAALLAANSYKDAAGNIMVPKDPENFKKYAKKRVEDAGAWAQDLPHVPHNHIDKAVEIIQTPGLIQQYLAPAGEMLEDVGVNILKMATLSERELLMKTNDKGLYSFGTDLRNLQLDHPEGSEEYEQLGILIKDIKELRHRVKSGAVIKTEELTQTFAQKAKPLGINVFIHDGYIAWTWKKFKDGIPVLNGPRNIMVDPSLESGDARKKAQRFVSEDTVWNAPGRVVGTFFEDVRMFADDILFKDAKNMDDMTRIVDKKLNSGAYIAVYGGAAWLYEAGEGVLHRYALGPARLLEHIGKGITGDLSAVEAAVDYSGGLLPVLIMGMTANMARGNFRKAFSKRILLETAAYPIKGLADWGRMGTHIGRNIRNPRAIVKDPALKVHAEFFRTAHQLKFIQSKFQRGELSKILGAEHQTLARLYEAKRYLHEAQYKSSFLEEALHDKVKGALSGVEGLDSAGLNSRSAEGMMSDISKQIKRRETLIKRIEQKEILVRALQKVEQGKSEQAKHLLNKLDAKETISPTKEAITTQLERVEKKIELLDQKLNPVQANREKAAKRREAIKERQEALGEPESAKKTTKLSTEEKAKLIENVKGSKKDLEKLGLEYERAHQAEVEKLTNEGIKAGSPEYEKRISTVREHHAEKAFAFYKEKGLHNLDLLDDATLKKHGFDPQKVREGVPHLESKVHGHGKLKKFGKGVVAFAAGLLTMYGISKGLEWFHQEDKGFEIEKLGSSEKPNSKKKSPSNKKELRENVDQHKEALTQIQRYFSSMQLDYQKLNALLGDPKKLKNSSSDEVKRLVQEASGKHEKNIEKIKKYVSVNRDAFLVYYERLPKAKDGKDKSLSQFFSIGFDSSDNRPYLKYADTTDFRDTYYEIVDMYREHMDKLIKGEKLDGWDTAAHGAKYAAPVYGTYLDGRDAVRAIGRGEWGSAAKSGAWCTLGLVSDVLMVAGVVSFGATTVAGGALKGVRAASAGTKGVLKGARAVAIMEKLEKAAKVLRESEKLAKAAKFAHTGSLVGMGADIGRQVFIPPKSQTYYF